MSSYRLEKLEIKKGKTSGVRAGALVVGNIAAFRELKLDSDNDSIKEDPKIEDIKVGGMLVVLRSPYDFTKTSEIIDILEVGENSIKFETGSSIYLLEILNE